MAVDTAANGLEAVLNGASTFLDSFIVRSEGLTRSDSSRGEFLSRDVALDKEWGGLLDDGAVTPKQLSNGKSLGANHSQHQSPNNMSKSRDAKDPEAATFKGAPQKSGKASRGNGVPFVRPPMASSPSRPSLPSTAGKKTQQDARKTVSTKGNNASATGAGQGQGQGKGSNVFIRPPSGYISPPPSASNSFTPGFVAASAPRPSTPKAPLQHSPAAGFGVAASPAPAPAPSSPGARLGFAVKVAGWDSSASPNTILQYCQSAQPSPMPRPAGGACRAEPASPRGGAISPGPPQRCGAQTPAPGPARSAPGSATYRSIDRSEFGHSPFRSSDIGRGSSGDTLSLSKIAAKSPAVLHANPCTGRNQPGLKGASLSSATLRGYTAASPPPPTRTMKSPSSPRTLHRAGIRARSESPGPFPMPPMGQSHPLLHSRSSLGLISATHLPTNRTVSPAPTPAAPPPPFSPVSKRSHHTAHLRAESPLPVHSPYSARSISPHQSALPSAALLPMGSMSPPVPAWPPPGTPFEWSALQQMLNLGQASPPPPGMQPNRLSTGSCGGAPQCFSSRGSHSPLPMPPPLPPGAFSPGCPPPGRCSTPILNGAGAQGMSSKTPRVVPPHRRSLSPTLPVAAHLYTSDPSDPIDNLLWRQLRELDQEALSKVMIRRVGPGKYEFDGKAVSVVRAPPEEPGGEAQLLVSDDEVPRGQSSVGMPLLTYLYLQHVHTLLRP